jgi:hypothetical protein
MKCISFLTTFILLSLLSFGQCNIKIDNNLENAISYSSASEELYRNEDLENGFNIFTGNFVLLTQKVDKNKMKFILVVSQKKSSYQPTIVPRSLTFYFTNGEYMELNADELDSPISKGDVTINTCYYRLALNIIEKIRTTPLKQLLFSDNRTEKKILTNQYSKIFIEQIDCLYKKAAE